MTHACSPAFCRQGGRAGIGKGASVLRDVEIFDPATNTWCSGAPMVRQSTNAGVWVEFVLSKALTYSRVWVSCAQQGAGAVHVGDRVILEYGTDLTCPSSPDALLCTSP